MVILYGFIQMVILNHSINQKPYEYIKTCAYIFDNSLNGYYMLAEVHEGKLTIQIGEELKRLN
jgi:hypothetical protein